MDEFLISDEQKEPSLQFNLAYGNSKQAGAGAYVFPCDVALIFTGMAWRHNSNNNGLSLVYVMRCTQSIVSHHAMNKFVVELARRD
ncbi:hypothetical protein RRG08_054475 [Elysia crispata]|uniref:Uncharacterized protein n=1 Tax=Elysia crispata TaxID=231223 RepID=A0AAE0Y8P4_9GAST|nr:hypothetical protein RRG08_054475 [Elysia crispata]